MGSGSDFSSTLAFTKALARCREGFRASWQDALHHLQVLQAGRLRTLPLPLSLVRFFHVSMPRSSLGREECTVEGGGSMDAIFL